MYSKYLKTDIGKHALGVCDTDNKSIYVSDNLPEDKRIIVIAHELTHAYIYMLGIILDSESEENIANMVSMYGMMICIEASILAQKG